MLSQVVLLLPECCYEIASFLILRAYQDCSVIEIIVDPLLWEMLNAYMAELQSQYLLRRKLKYSTWADGSGMIIIRVSVLKQVCCCPCLSVIGDGWITHLGWGRNIRLSLFFIALYFSGKYIRVFLSYYHFINTVLIHSCSQTVLHFLKKFVKLFLQEKNSL